MLIITGLGRCGTSILMRMLELSGVAVGRHSKWVPELDAGMEAAPAYTLTIDMYDLFCLKNEQINLDTPARGDFWAGYTIREGVQCIKNGDRKEIGETVVIKDPRITWHPWIIRGWWEALNCDMRVLFLHRISANIDKSRKLFAHADPKSCRIGHPETYRDDFYWTLMEMLIYDISFELMLFPNFLRDCDMVVEKLKRVKLEFDEAKFREVWEATVDFSKVHF